MSIWIAQVDVGGCESAYRYALIDSVRERPLCLPLFDDEDSPRDFLSFAELAGYDARALIAMGHDSMDRLYAAWLRACEADRGLGAA